MESQRDQDPFGPPAIPTFVHCLHCHEEYESYLIQWVEGERYGIQTGFWTCPTPGCDGIGFGFDIWPVDPDYRDENGEPMCFFDDEDEEEDGGYEDAFDDDVEFNDPRWAPGEWSPGNWASDSAPGWSPVDPPPPSTRGDFEEEDDIPF